MNTVHIVRIGLVGVIFAVAGCKSQNTSVSSNTEKPAQKAPVVAPVAEQAPAEEAPYPSALAQKTKEYAQAVEPAARPKALATEQPSPVQWTEAKRPTPVGTNSGVALPLTPAAGAADPSPPAPADAAHLAALRQSAQGNALNDVPAIVPESSDFPAKKEGSDGLEQRLGKQVHDNPRDIAGQLDYQLYEMLKDDSSPQLASVSMLPTEDRELVSALVDGVANFRTTVRQDNNTLLSKKIQPILDMADRVRTEAELSIPVVSLCSKVSGYGKYDPIDPARFPAGQANQVIVYCEIANFASQVNDRQMWESRLRQEVTMFTETGMPVWHDKPREVIDECRNRRHDFFVYDLVNIPANLSIGRYIMKVTIEDETAKRVREATVPVEIVAQP